MIYVFAILAGLFVIQHYLWLLQMRRDRREDREYRQAALKWLETQAAMMRHDVRCSDLTDEEQRDRARLDYECSKKRDLSYLGHE